MKQLFRVGHEYSNKYSRYYCHVYDLVFQVNGRDHIVFLRGWGMEFNSVNDDFDTKSCVKCMYVLSLTLWSLSLSLNGRWSSGINNQPFLLLGPVLLPCYEWCPGGWGREEDESSCPHLWNRSV